MPMTVASCKNIGILPECDVVILSEPFGKKYKEAFWAGTIINSCECLVSICSSSEEHGPTLSFVMRNNQQSMRFNGCDCFDIICRVAAKLWRVTTELNRLSSLKLHSKDVTDLIGQCFVLMSCFIIECMFQKI